MIGVDLAVLSATALQDGEPSTHEASRDLCIRMKAEGRAAQAGELVMGGARTMFSVPTQKFLLYWVTVEKEWEVGEPDSFNPGRHESENG